MAKLLINTFLFFLIILVVIMAGCSVKTNVATLAKSHQFVESVPYIVSHRPKLYKEYLQRQKKGIDWSRTNIDKLENKFLVTRIKEKEMIRLEMKQNARSTNSLNFGHEKKPKKRVVGKRIFCKECHIVH